MLLLSVNRGGRRRIQNLADVAEVTGEEAQRLQQLIAGEPHLRPAGSLRSFCTTWKEHQPKGIPGWLLYILPNIFIKTFTDLHQLISISLFNCLRGISNLWVHFLNGRKLIKPLSWLADILVSQQRIKLLSTKARNVQRSQHWSLQHADRDWLRNPVPVTSLGTLREPAYPIQRTAWFPRDCV